MKTLVIGDVFGGDAVRALVDALPALRERWAADFVIVNAENAAAGLGTSPRQAEDLLEAGADVLSGGNHTLHRRELFPLLGSDPRVLRPANLAVNAPGDGFVVHEVPAGRVAVINLVGSVFMETAQSPFAVCDELVGRAMAKTSQIFVDIHAEATSEKVALARHLDGRVTAVLGTHTHVQTADARVLAGGTAAMTDLGMTGPHDSVIGVRAEAAVQRFLTSTRTGFSPAEDDLRIQGAVVTSDEAGRARAIESFDLEAGPPPP